MTTRTTHPKITKDSTDAELEAYADYVASDDYVPGPDAQVDDTRDLAAVAKAADAVKAAEARLLEAVGIARAHDRSWGRIGVALGVTRQAARQRFDRLIRGVPTSSVAWLGSGTVGIVEGAEYTETVDTPLDLDQVLRVVASAALPDDPEGRYKVLRAVFEEVASRRQSRR